jgi:hypothetical protein
LAKVEIKISVCRCCREESIDEQEILCNPWMNEWVRGVFAR